MGRKILLSAFIIIFIFTCYAVADNSIDPVKTYSGKMPFMPGEIIVKYKNIPQTGGNISGFSCSALNSQPVQIKKLLKKSSVNRKVSFMTTGGGSDRIDEPGVYKIKYQGRDDVYSIVDELKNNPDVEYAEPNYIYQTTVIPNDPNYNLEWGFSRIGAPAAWDVTKGSSEVVIAIIDTGVDYRHQDLSQNIWINADEVPNNGLDDDGNGYIDDCIGYDFVNIPADWVAQGEDPGPPDNDPMDCVGHGTHVAGIAAGRPNNGLGIAGAAWNCKIMPVRAGYKYIDGNGYLELSDIVEAIYYAADNSANVINMSFGSLYSSFLMQEAVDYAHGKGCIMVAAAGNVDSYDVQKPFYPAAYDHVIAVTAVDDRDKVAVWNMFAFSNFGDFTDMCAPGSGILSTLPNNTYGYGSGTSMAAPFVSGVAALVKSKHKDWNADQVEDRIKATCDDIYGINPQSFFIGQLGAGRVNAKRALGNLSMAITYPKPDSIISGSVVVKGSASMENFTSYDLEYSCYPSTEAWITIVADSTQPVEDGLLAIWNVTNPDGRYNLRLTINNASGESYQYVSGVNFGVDGEVKLSGKPQCGPSPFDPQTSNFLFYYDMLNAADVDIYVYDISGTLVWQRALPYEGGGTGNGGSAGPNRVFWDGTNGFGQRIGNGAYIYMIIARDSGERKIIGRGKFAVLRS